MSALIKPLSALSLAALLLVACKSESPTPSPVAAESEPEPAAATETGADKGAPKIAADEPVFEFGTIKASDSIEHVFKIKNVGDADLHIERVQRTWGCTATVLSADVLPPGGEGEIKVTLRPKGNHREITKKIMVITDDPEQPKFALTMKGELLVDMIASPTVVTIRDLKVGEAGTATFTLERGEGTSAEVTEVGVEDKDNFSVRKLDDPELTWEVRFAGRDSVGTSSTRVVVKTTGPNTPELVIPVRASAALNLRYVRTHRFTYREGAPSERTIRISARHGDAPKIRKVEDPDGLLDIEILAPQGPMASVHLKLREDEFAALDGSAKAAPHKLIVHTSDHDEPVIEMDYRIGAPPARGSQPSR